MKPILKLTIIIILICHSQYYSQKYSKEDHLKIKENSKGLSLKIKDLKTVEKNGKTSWTVKATLTNNSRDTLFYFINPDREPGYFLVMAMVQSISLFVDLEAGDITKQTVIAVPPSGQRTVNLEISSKYPAPSSFKFRVFLSVHKAKNMDERIPHDVLMRMRDRQISVGSNRIKTLTPDGKASQSIIK